jgi:hypothetical protein
MLYVDITLDQMMTTGGHSTLSGRAAKKMSSSKEFVPYWKFGGGLF